MTTLNQQVEIIQLKVLMTENILKANLGPKKIPFEPKVSFENY